jgi:hypothetical protein
MTTLGRLERFDHIRTVWPGEESAFTPWLALEENLRLLSEAIGVGPEGLELVATEVPLPDSSYHADVLCRETGAAEDALVLIENQFGASDHHHLGKLLTYAGGLKARTVVLIGETIRSEHRAALDWLNGLATEGFRFFAVEIELWRIGDSLPAPRFNVVVEPNDWTRGVAEARKASEDQGLSASRQMLIDYWTEFAKVLAARKGPVRPVKPQPQSWVTHSLGKSGVTLNATVNRRENWVMAEVYLTGRTAQPYFDALKQDRTAIETDFGGVLEWYDAANIDRRIFTRKHFPQVKDRQTWPQQHEWLAEQLEALYRAFHNRVRRLIPDLSTTPE